MPVHSKPVTRATFLRIVRDCLLAISSCKLGWDPAELAESFARAAIPRHATMVGLHAMNEAVAQWAALCLLNLSISQFDTFMQVWMSREVQDALGDMLDLAGNASTAFSLLPPSSRVRWVYSHALVSALAGPHDPAAPLAEFIRQLSPALETIAQLVYFNDPPLDLSVAPAPGVSASNHVPAAGHDGLIPAGDVEANDFTVALEVPDYVSHGTRTPLAQVQSGENTTPRGPVYGPPPSRPDVKGKGKASTALPKRAEGPLSANTLSAFAVGAPTHVPVPLTAPSVLVSSSVPVPSITAASSSLAAACLVAPPVPAGHNAPSATPATAETLHLTVPLSAPATTSLTSAVVPAEIELQPPPGPSVGPTVGGALAPAASEDDSF